MKVTINGEVYAFDANYQPLIEALTIERALKIPFVQYEERVEAERKSGDMRAETIAVFAWQVLHRHRPELTLDDVLDGTFEIDMAQFTAEREGETDPTTPPLPPSSTTGGVTSESSLSGSESGPGRSGGSPSPSSSASSTT